VAEYGPNQYEKNLLPHVGKFSYLIQTINSLANGLVAIMISFDMIILNHLYSQGNNGLTRPTVQQRYNQILPH
jgi:hypothetical protein